MKLISFFYKKDDINSPYGRQWRTIHIISIRSSLVNIGWETQLTHWEFKKIEPRPVSGLYLSIEFNPLKWKIEENHIYYDSTHCFFQKGPFIYSKSNFGECKKCLETTDE